MATVLESVRIILGIEAKGFASVSGQIKSLHQGIERNVASLKTAVAGYFTIAAGKELVGAVSTMAERWKDISEQTGLSTDAVQKYDAAFKKVGLSAEDAAAAFDLLTEKRRQALEEGGASAQLFRAFGISEQELKGLTSGASIFERLAQGRSAGNQGDRELFGQMFGSKGRKAGKLLAGANSLSEGGELRLMSEADIKAIDDSAKRFEAAARDFKIAASPLVAALSDWIATAVKFWTDEKRKDSDVKVSDLFLRPDKFGALLGNGTPAVSNRPLITPDRGGLDPLNGLNEGQPGVFRTGANGEPFLDTGAGVYSKDAERARNKLNESVFSTLFKVGNTGQQKTLLKQQMDELLKQANEVADSDPNSALKKAELRGKAFGLAGNLAELTKQQSGMFSPDSLAAVGGIVGGAGIAADPGLNVAQSTLEATLEILSTNKELLDAFRESPMKDLR